MDGVGDDLEEDEEVLLRPREETALRLIPHLEIP